ncbi:ISL3 family transposase [Gemelliphila palaticanis]|uniref:ISL3 family transposase n=1 Tax=Gemelliphila palaticanis TaxID=81950 RepID=A0ABX2SYD5_9BACL|nr:ISL3 family transposase [Gemella palaticanis]MBF0715343.1 ISL3 family transposase [Gemella palaticanis]NYS47273.1 ISL3 family transposase [Gemella palaticanis]
MDNVMLDILNLRDTRIRFKEKLNEIFKIELRKGEKIKIVEAVLSYIPKKCKYCSCEKLVKNGFDIVELQLPKVASTKTILRLQKQKVICKECSRGFTVYCKDHKKHSRKSFALLNEIDFCLSTTSNSMTNIANQSNTSVQTVKRKISDMEKEIKINKNSLPRVLCIDEVNGVSTNLGKYNCLLVDGEKKKVKDFLITRRKNFLDKYFYEYDIKIKNKVEFFVTDMWDTYISLAKKHFKNAKIIIDKFHIIKNMVSAIDDIRIKFMNEHSKNSYEYRLFKKYNKKLKKRFSKISTEYKKYRYNPELQSEFSVLEKLLSYCPELSQAYGYLQDLYTAFEYGDVEKFRKIISDEKIFLIDNKKWRDCIRTFIKYKEYIENAIIYPYTNGVTEAFNRQIKEIKRSACGFRNYYNFRTRVLLFFNFIERKR